MEFHRPVLRDKCIELLNIKEGGVYVDATFGGGGHSKAILEKLGDGVLLAFDRDSDAHDNRLDDERVTLIRSNYKFIDKEVTALGYTKVDGILADLGISSHQIDTPERGFSHRFDGPLDMRMDDQLELTANEIVNTYSDEELAKIFREYGELKSAWKVAKEIERHRAIKPLNSINDLLQTVDEVIPQKARKKVLSQLFQALRIEVNDELDAVKTLLQDGMHLLAQGGRMVIMSYHSLEDRMVKRFFRFGNHDQRDERDSFGNRLSPLKLITRKVIVPDEEEIYKNPRARSARLRAAEKI